MNNPRYTALYRWYLYPSVLWDSQLEREIDGVFMFKFLNYFDVYVYNEISISLQFNTKIQHKFWSLNMQNTVKWILSETNLYKHILHIPLPQNLYICSI